MTSAPHPEDRPARRRDLHWAWRALLAFTGILLCLLSLALFSNPPIRKDWQAVGTLNQALNQAQGDPTTFCIALLGVGVLALLVAANGRKLLEVSSGGAKFDGPSADQVADDVERSQSITAQEDTREPVAAAGPERTFERDGFEYQVFSADSVPLRVIADVVQAKPDAVKTIDDIAYAFRRTGKGNHAWFIRTERGLTLQVSYGGQGKSEATVQAN